MGRYFAFILAAGAGLLTVLAVIESKKCVLADQEDYFKSYHDHHQNQELQTKYGEDFHIV